MPESYGLYRLALFLIIFIAMLTWETKSAFLENQIRFSKRRLNNITVSIINTFVLRFLGPISALGAASWAATHSIGLFNVVHLPLTVTAVVSVVFLDFSIYVQHLAAHRFSWFWRIHRMHHADPFFDVTTAVRFHPLEIVLSTFIKMTIVAILGAPVMAVLIFEIILSGMALFNHGNVSLPPAIETKLRWFLVTPDMHRIHHSQNVKEHHSNFGFNLSIWDRIFKTYTQQIRDIEFSLGLAEFPDKKQNSTLLGMLTIVFTSKASK